jgi:hypothetical protein
LTLSQLDDLALGGRLGGGVTVSKPDDYTIRATTELENVDTETDPNLPSRVRFTVPLNLGNGLSVGRVSTAPDRFSLCRCRVCLGIWIPGA